MIKTGSIYLVVKDFDKSLDFYKQLLEKDVSAQNKTRFAIFHLNGLCICLMNGYFDTENPEQVVTQGKYYEVYDDMVAIAKKENSGKVVINLGTDDLRTEYERIRKLGIGMNVTDIRYINAGSPYYYFCLQDPDGNAVEITGPFEEDKYAEDKQ